MTAVVCAGRCNAVPCCTEPCLPVLCSTVRCSRASPATLSTPLPGPWVNYELTVCVKGTTTCLTNLPLCAVSGSTSVTDCQIPGCQPLTTYDVTIVALESDSSKSPISNKDDFQTPAAP